MGLNDKFVSLSSDRNLLRPCCLNSSGTVPRDKLSAKWFSSDGIHLGDTLHSRIYFCDSHNARYLLPTKLEDRPFRNQKKAFSLSVYNLTKLPLIKSPNKRIATMHANNSFRAMNSVAA